MDESRQSLPLSRVTIVKITGNFHSETFTGALSVGDCTAKPSIRITKGPVYRPMNL